MSGVKTVTMSTYERDRLMRQASQAQSLSVTNEALRRINNDLNRTVQDANSRITTLNGNINRVNSALAAQKKDADRQAEALRQQLQQAVRESNQRLSDQAQAHARQLADMQNGFQAAIDSTREEVASAMAANNRRIERVIADNNAALQSQIDSVQSNVTQVAQVVEGVVNSNDSLLAMARQYQAMADELNRDSRNYRCELLLPGELSGVLAAAEQAQSDITLSEKLPTNAPVARDNARIAYERAIEFHERIVRAEEAWNLANQAAAQAIVAARSQVEASREVEVTEGGRTATTDVECWSNGGISALEQRVDGLESSLTGENTMEELQQIRAAAEQLVADTQETVVFAMGATICSQSRPDTAAALGRRIKEATGLSLVSYGYDGNDQRAAHRMVLRNPHTGMEIVVIQKPEVQRDGTIVNRLEHHVVDYGGNNMADTDATVLAVLQTLGGVCQTVPGYENCPSDQVTAAQVQQQLQETAQTVATVPGGTGSAPKPEVRKQ